MINVYISISAIDARILYKEKANAYSAHMQIKNALAGVYRMDTPFVSRILFCPLSWVAMMYFMNKENKYAHNEKKNNKQK